MDAAMNNSLTTKEAAQYIGMSEAFLERDRSCAGDGKIPFVRVGTRAVRYRRTDLDNYLASQVRKSADTGRRSS
jgi:excisionase family DNA binding protein